MRIEDVKLEEIKNMTYEEVCHTFASEEVTGEQLEEIKKHDFFSSLKKDETEENDFFVNMLGGHFFSVTLRK